jgi:hypothetical protein
MAKKEQKKRITFGYDALEAENVSVAGSFRSMIGMFFPIR